MDIVQLKNGSEEALPIVSVTMVRLRRLLKEKPIHFFELVSFARNPEHEFFGQTGRDLVMDGLVTLGHPTGRWAMHDSVKNVILSAVEGDGLDLVLGDPRKEVTRA